MNKYHFTISIHFNNDYPVDKLESILNLKPSKITLLKDSFGKNKSAKFVYTTKTFDDIYTDKIFAQFIKSVKENLIDLPNILSKNNGTCTIRIVFEQLKEKPCLSLSNEVLKTLANLNINYDIQF